MDNEVFNTVASCVSALAAGAATYFAARTLKTSNAASRAEFNSGRPYFTFSEFGLRRPTISKALTSDKDLLDPTAGLVEGLIRNVGRRPASNVSGSILILPLHAHHEIRVFSIGIADDVAPATDWNVTSGRLQIIPKDYPGSDAMPVYIDPGFFVVIGVSYDDPLASTSFSQASFMRWPGISNRVVSGILVSATRDEKTSLVQMHSRLLQPFISSK